MKVRCWRFWLREIPTLYKRKKREADGKENVNGSEKGGEAILNTGTSPGKMFFCSSKKTV